MQKLLIHGGIQRTATTAVQMALKNNNRLLERHGVIYPNLERLNEYAPASPQAAVNHQHLVWEFHSGRMPPSAIEPWIDYLKSQPAMTIVLSGEDFCILRDFLLIDILRKHFDVSVVFYLRRQDNWLNSWYNQHVKWPFDRRLSIMSPMEFLACMHEFSWLNYYDLLDKWASIIGSTNVHPRVFEKDQTVDPVRDFFNLCGIDEFVVEPTLQRANESVPADHLEILRRLDVDRFSEHTRNLILEILDTLPKCRSPMIYPTPLRELILNQFTDQNKRTAARWFGRHDGTLFHDATMEDSPSLEQFIVPVDHQTLFAFIEEAIRRMSAPQALYQIFAAQQAGTVPNYRKPNSKA